MFFFISTVPTEKRKYRPLFEIHFLWDSCKCPFGNYISRSGQEKWTGKYWNWTTGATHLRETNFQSELVLGASWTIFFENKFRKSLKQIYDKTKWQLQLWDRRRLQACFFYWFPIVTGFRFKCFYERDCTVCCSFCRWCWMKQDSQVEDWEE